MKQLYVRDLKPDAVADVIVLVQAKEIRQKRTGEPFLSLTLADRTGDIDARMWDNVAEVLDAFGRDDFVKVRGQLQVYNSRPQFIVHKVRRIADSEVDFSDFFPASVRDPEAMWTELRGLVSAVKNPSIRALLDSFLDDPEIAARYKTAPAAKSIHHAFRAGLLEHVLSLCGLARAVSAHYGNVDFDLLLAGIVLHDIGKIYELTYERSFGYSSAGQLLGHIAIGMRMLQEKLSAMPGFPSDLRTLIEHMILSHHGKLEFGSPKVPMFPEALLLHYLDDMDSKMESMRASLAKDAMSEGEFTSWNPALERILLRKEKFMGDGAPTEPTAPQNQRDSAPAGLFGDRLRAALTETAPEGKA